MTSAAIYTRSSSTHESERSILEQARLCRTRAAHEGWTVVAEFPDVAPGDASSDRPGLNAMLGRMAQFDLIVTETLDRIGRQPKDVAASLAGISAAGCRLTTVSEGQIGEPPARQVEGPL